MSVGGRGGGGGGRGSDEVAGREQEAGGRWVRHDQSTSAARSSGSAGAGVKTGNACTHPEKLVSRVEIPRTDRHAVEMMTVCSSCVLRAGLGLDAGAIAPGLGSDPLAVVPPSRTSCVLRWFGCTTASLVLLALLLCSAGPSPICPERSQIARRYEASLRSSVHPDRIAARSSRDASSRAGSDFDVFAVGRVAGRLFGDGRRLWQSMILLLMTVVERGARSLRRRRQLELSPYAGLPGIHWHVGTSAWPSTA